MINTQRDRDSITHLDACSLPHLGVEVEPVSAAASGYERRDKRFVLKVASDGYAISLPKRIADPLGDIDARIDSEFVDFRGELLRHLDAVC